MPTSLGGIVGMDGLKSDRVEDFRKGIIMEMDIGMDLISENSAITARRMGISLMNDSSSCGKSKSLRMRTMKITTSPSSLVAASLMEKVRWDVIMEVFQRW
jgi:hypothetical protein